MNVSKEVFEKHIEGFDYAERITWSSPMRWNYYKNGKMIGFRDDSYGDISPEQFEIYEN